MESHIEEVWARLALPVEDPISRIDAIKLYQFLTTATLPCLQQARKKNSLNETIIYLYGNKHHYPEDIRLLITKLYSNIS